MATIQPKHEKCMKNERFVDNIPAGDDLTELEGIKYRIGNIAYDIHGKEIASNYMHPLFIKKEDYENMMQ